MAVPLKRGAAIPEICYLEREEIVAIFDAVDKKTGRGRRDYALLLFTYNTGARVQEASDTLISWLALEKPYRVEILGKGHKWRTCPLWDSTAQVLKNLIAERAPRNDRDAHLFLNRLGQPISRFGIANVVGKYAAKASKTVPSLQGKKITPHTIRHTTAMHLLQSGVEVNVIRSWLGHVSLATTNRYIEIDMKMKAEALEACSFEDKKAQRCRWKSNPDILAWLETL